ncbi:Neurotransmitter-gated ion-channel transmembrane region domain containing protein [Trichostrongylus colubriformis]|uniref:Neurotransmitter-gated ion-channel transmembrane region domain containing protein n=1 Tax=Trichostrongylus colubriformis TaxID=6319 RepID=A0AAN8FRA5_TRICO
MSRTNKVDPQKPPSCLVDPKSLVGYAYRRDSKISKPFDLPNNFAPKVAFRKPKRSKKRVDDIIFVNLLQQVRFIAEHFQHNERESEISDDWTFVAMVLDRLFLLIFSVLNVGTMFIILEAPSLYDYSEPMNITVPNKPLGQANLLGSHSRLL